MKRAAIGALIVLSLAVAPAAQDWRATAVASFDDAWKVINDTFYDPTFGGLDWKAVATELRPRVQAAASADDARAVIREMLARLKRSHFVLLAASMDDALPGPAVVPVDVRMTPEGALITRLTDPSAARAGLSAGMTLLRIDGRPVADMVARAQGLDDRMKDLDAWGRINQALHGADGSMAALDVRLPDGATRVVKVPRGLGGGETVTLGNLPPLRVVFESRAIRTPAGRRAGLIWFSYWMTSIGDRFERAIDEFRKADGLVIDLRGNPGGLAGMVGGIAGHVMIDRALLGTMRTRETELMFRANPRFVTADARKVTPFAGPVAILVDELTASTSEVFAGGLQSLGRARVFGRQSMGQALPASTRQLPNGDVLIHAIGDFVTSTGKSLEGGGVIPDVTVRLSPKALADGRDDTVEAAMRWIDTKKTGERGSRGTGERGSGPTR